MNRGWLLDTSALSRLAPGRPAVSHEIAGWLQRQSDRLFVPAIAVAELEAGISKLRRAGSTTRVQALSLWLDELITHYANRVLPFDTLVARRAGALSDVATGQGIHSGFADVAIAAIAIVHGLDVLAQNLRHFARLGVAVHDPFRALPPELP